MSSDMDSTATEPPSSPPPTPLESHPQPQVKTTTIEDVVLWKTKRLNVAAIVLSTATWVALEVYKLNFVTVASWAAIFVVCFFFIRGNIDRLLPKETSPGTPKLLHVSEETTAEMAGMLRRWVDQSVTFLLRFGAESKWYVVGGAVASLWLFSLISSRLDFITILYFGELGGLSVPIMYNKYEQKINESGQRLKAQYRRCYSMILQKSKELNNIVMQKTGDLKKKVSSKQKEKKRE